MKQLSELVRLFTQLPNASIGCGPEHPLHPDTTYTNALNQLFTEHTNLYRYPDYTEFLRRHVGAAIASERSPDPFVAIYGFGEFDDDVTEVVTTDEFYVFAESYSEFDCGKTAYYGFALNLADDRQDGIYRAHVPETERPPHDYIWFCPTFTEWLDQLIERSGVFLELDSQGKPI